MSDREPAGDVPLTVLVGREAKRRGLTVHFEGSSFGPGGRRLQRWVFHGQLDGRLLLTFTPSTGVWQLPTDNPADSGTCCWKVAVMLAGRVARGLRDGLEMRAAIRWALGEREGTDDDGSSGQLAT